MKLIGFVFSFVPALVAGSSSSYGGLSQLAADLDRITPGGSKWFAQWGVEERLLDTVDSAMAGHPLPPNMPADFINVASIGYYVLYKNPTVSMTGFISSCSAYARNLNVQATQTRWAKFYTQQQSFTACPPWFHDFIGSMHRNGLNRSTIIEQATTYVHNNPQVMNSFAFPPSNDPRQFDIQLATLIRIWIDYCIDAPAGSCVLNLVTERWEPSRDARERINRFMLLVILRK